MTGFGLGPLSGMELMSFVAVKTEENCWFQMFAMDSLSEYVRSSVSLSDAIPNVSHLSLFKKLQNRFWLFVIWASYNLFFR